MTTTPPATTITTLVDYLDDLIQRKQDDEGKTDNDAITPTPCIVHFATSNADEEPTAVDLSKEMCGIAQCYVLEAILQELSEYGNSSLIIFFGRDTILAPQSSATIPLPSPAANKQCCFWTRILRRCCSKPRICNDKNDNDTAQNNDVIINRRFMTINAFHNWFESKYTTNGGRGFYDYMNRQPIQCVHVYLIDPTKIQVNNPTKTTNMIAPLCTIDLVEATTEEVEEGEGAKLMLAIRDISRSLYTILKMISNAYIQGCRSSKIT